MALPIKNDISDRMIVERGIRSTSTASIASGESADERKNVITAFMASAMTASITMSMPDGNVSEYHRAAEKHPDQFAGGIRHKQTEPGYYRLCGKVKQNDR